MSNLRYSMLGSLPYQVSRLCFGALTIGPLQRNMDPVAGGAVVLAALERGVNFIDTAQMYGTYEHIAWALARTDAEPLVVSKSYAFTEQDMEVAVTEARQLLGEKVPLVFLLHEQESAHTIRGHWPAVEFLLRAKSKGLVQGIGLSTHHVAAVQAATAVAEFDVISPLINLGGIGIQGGSQQDMLEAMEVAHQAGKGIYAMKPLGGGHLLQQRRAALQYLLDIPFIDAVAVGMKSAAEVEYNTCLFSGHIPDETATIPIRRLHIDEWCIGCGACAQVCGQNAIQVKNRQAVSDPEKCIFCGYCGAACPEFSIKVI